VSAAEPAGLLKEASMSTEEFRAPALRYLAMEPRFLAEASLLRAATPLLRRPSPHPHPVLVLPGLGATDRSTAALRAVLRRQGHWVHGWRLGRHRLWTRERVAAIERRFAELVERHGTPVSLVGVSAGGILARELARQYPQQVRQVITIVSPFRHRHGDDNRIAQVFAAIGTAPRTNHFETLEREEDRPALSMPCTSIYSRSDGLVDWRSCRETPGPRRDNIEVWSSHFGAATNLAVAIAVSERLACPPEDWRPFTPPPGTRMLFRRRPPANGYLPPPSGQVSSVSTNI
jgi:pimeloyl-ACP methyl ester carboxylesterase